MTRLTEKRGGAYALREGAEPEAALERLGRYEELQAAV